MEQEHCEFCQAPITSAASKVRLVYDTLGKILFLCLRSHIILLGVGDGGSTPYGSYQVSGTFITGGTITGGVGGGAKNRASSKRLNSV